MIGSATVGTNDAPRAAAFDDALRSELGAKRFMETDRAIAWAVSPTTPALGVGHPYDGKTATSGNGTMIALVVDSKDKVPRVHALALGGSDEGAPGPRGDGFYAVYFRDLDGNKLNCYVFGWRAAAP
jgi:hypothetical protein